LVWGDFQGFFPAWKSRSPFFEFRASKGRYGRVDDRRYNHLDHLDLFGASA